MFRGVELLLEAYDLLGLVFGYAFLVVEFGFELGNKLGVLQEDNYCPLSHH
jgi:hypothetical protein